MFKCFCWLFFWLYVKLFCLFVCLTIFLLKLDILSNTVATLDSGPFPPPPPICIIFVFAFLSTCLFSNLPGLKLYNLFPLGYIATDSSAQVGFGFVLAFIFKSGLLGIASIFTQLSGQLVTGQRLCSNTSNHKASTYWFVCGFKNVLQF